MRLSLCFLFVFSYALIAQKQMLNLPEWPQSEVSSRADLPYSNPETPPSTHRPSAITDTVIDAEICFGETYIFDGDTLSTSGQYEAVFTDMNGQDSVVVLNLTVFAAIADTPIEATICEESSYIFFDDTLTTSGVYTATLPAANGCDSNIVLTLTVREPDLTLLEESFCSGQSYLFNGENLTAPGVYTALLTDSDGCDSLIILNLSLLQTTNTAISAIFCEGESYNYNGQVLTTPGVYTDVLTGSNGCDSTVVLTLTQIEPDLTLLEETFCAGQSYLFNGEDLTAPGQYTALLTNANGCDSLVILNLTQLPVSSTAIEATICEEESYEFNGQMLTESGVYVEVLTGANGCDSTVALTLTVLEPDLTLIEASFCSGQSYLFSGEELTAPGEYTALLTNANGCDSLVILSLSLFPVTTTAIEATICAGSEYDFNGQILTEAGVFVDVQTGVNGCDSTIVLTLNVDEPDLTLLEASFCEGQSYLFNGEDLTAAGSYTALLSNANGCDSTVILTLTMIPVSVSVTVASICSNEPYTFNGEEYSETGIYVTVLTNALGCDSTDVLNLTVIPASYASTEARICAGETYEFEGDVLSESGTYTVNYTNAADCDSTIVLNLEVIGTEFSVVQEGQTLTATAEEGASIQWIDCTTNELIDGATANVFTPTLSGAYAAIITLDPCTFVSDCFTVTVVATSDPVQTSGWQLSPNPTSGPATLQLNAPATDALHLQVLDMAGRLCVEQNIPTGQQTAPIDLTGLPDGVFLVRLSGGAYGAITQRLVKATK